MRTVTRRSARADGLTNVDGHGLHLRGAPAERACTGRSCPIVVRVLVATVGVLIASVLLTAGSASAHGFQQCSGFDVKVYNVSCSGAQRVLGRYIGSGFTAHRYHGWNCKGSFPGSDGPGGLPGRTERRSTAIRCVRNSPDAGHQHLVAKQ